MNDENVVVVNALHKETLKNMKQLGSVQTRGTPMPATNSGKRGRTDFFLHQVDSINVRRLIGKIPNASVRQKFLNSFAGHKNMALKSGRKLATGVDLVYSQYANTKAKPKDRKLSLVAYYGNNTPNYIFLPEKYISKWARMKRSSPPRSPGRKGFGKLSYSKNVQQRMKLKLSQQAERDRVSRLGPFKGFSGTTGGSINKFGVLAARQAVRVPSSSLAGQSTVFNRGGRVGGSLSQNAALKRTETRYFAAAAGQAQQAAAKLAPRQQPARQPVRLFQRQNSGGGPKPAWPAMQALLAHQQNQQRRMTQLKRKRNNNNNQQRPMAIRRRLN